MSSALPPLDAKSSASRSNMALTIGMVALIAVLIIPLPTFVLDLLITLNVTGSFLILMTTLSASSPLSFSTFPSVLLFTALLRLSLNVASTRLILLQGDAGSVIQAFGDFVVGGNYAVGIVIFLVLVIIQFVVITKGQNRIAEVAARFTLDALPGKQMAIDADLNAGIISNEEARDRRAEIARESEFYGAMDGAGKFVRGDAVAGLIITAVNIIGGILIGTLMQGADVSQAMSKYTILTIGDGLVSQIPGLVVSIASGILTTKAASKADLADEMVLEVLGKPGSVRLAGSVMLALGLVPGLPTVPFMLLGGGLVVFSLRTAKKEREKAVEPEAEEEDETLEEERKIEDLLQVDRLGIEIGYRLISIVDPGRHGGLLDHIASLRRQFASSLGIVIPPIRVKDNIQLEPNQYRVLLMGQEIASGELRAGQFLAMDPTGTAAAIEGTDTIEPAFGIPAKWITEGQKEQAEVLGYTVIDAPSVLVTHLTEVIRGTSSELLSREDVQALLENAKKHAPTVVEEVVPGCLSTSQLQRVLTDLLKERVSVRNLPLILEAIGDASNENKEHGHIVESVRLKLSRAIVDPLLDPAGALHAATIDPGLEQQLIAAVTGNGQAGGDLLAQGALGTFVERTAETLAQLVRTGHQPVLITRAALRPFLAEAVVPSVPGSAVLSYQEIAHVSDIDILAQVKLEGVAA